MSFGVLVLRFLGLWGLILEPLIEIFWLRFRPSKGFLRLGIKVGIQSGASWYIDSAQTFQLTALGLILVI